jgi:hypothetical protein
MGYKNLHFFMEACTSHNHLPLDTLAAVKNYLLAFALYQNGWQTSLWCWNAARRAQKHYF